MKWVFIDYENVGTLAKLDLSIYDRIVLFLGAKQPRIDFSEKRYEKPLDFVVVQLKTTNKDNLDFHLAYYLGKYDSETNKEIAFDVISNDSGFSPLISHIKSNGRKCKQVKLTNLPSDTQKLIQNLSSKPINSRPKSINGLKNYIGSQLGIKGNDVAIQNHVNQLQKADLLTVLDLKVSYK